MVDRKKILDDLQGFKWLPPSYEEEKEELIRTSKDLRLAMPILTEAFKKGKLEEASYEFLSQLRNSDFNASNNTIIAIINNRPPTLCPYSQRVHFRL